MRLNSIFVSSGPQYSYSNININSQRELRRSMYMSLSDMTHAWLDVTRNAGITRIVRMSYRSKTYTWNDVIRVKRSMIRGFQRKQYLNLL